MLQSIPSCSDPKYQVVNASSPNGCPVCVSSSMDYLMFVYLCLAGRDAPSDKTCPPATTDCIIGIPPTRDTTTGCLSCRPVPAPVVAGQCTGTAADRDKCFKIIMPTLRLCGLSYFYI